MDLLDRVGAPGRDLLGRVDAALMSAGAPDGHPVWALLREVGALPGDVLDAVGALRPDALRAAALDLRKRAEGYTETRAEIDAGLAAAHWSGESADEFAARWHGLAAHLGDLPVPESASMAGRLAATAGYAESLAGWMRESRRDLAGAVAEALGSLEAVRLHGGDSTAAAAIGALVLEVARRRADAAEAIAQRWAPLLGDLPFAGGPAGGPARRGAAPTELAL